MAAGGPLDNCTRSPEKYPCIDPIPQTDREWLIIGDRLDQGAYGAIYMAREAGNEGEQRILKVYRAGNEDEVKREVCLQNIAARAGIAPQIFDYWKCNETPNAGVIIMARGGNMTLEGLYRQKSLVNPTNIASLTSVFQVLKALVWLWIQTTRLNIQVEILHLDLHPNNVLIEVRDGEVESLRIIDFGKSQYLADVMNMAQEDINRAGQTPVSIANHIQQAIKYLYADRLMVPEFLEDFIRDQDFPHDDTKLTYKFFHRALSELDLNNGLLKLRPAFWYPEDRPTKDGLNDYLDNALDVLKGDIEEFLDDHLPGKVDDGWDFAEDLFQGLLED